MGIPKDPSTLAFKKGFNGAFFFFFCFFFLTSVTRSEDARLENCSGCRFERFI